MGSRTESNKEPCITRESLNAREGIYPCFRFFYGRLPGDTVGPFTPCFPLNPETVLGSVKNRGFIHAYSCWLESGESEGCKTLPPGVVDPFVILFSCRVVCQPP